MYSLYYPCVVASIVTLRSFSCVFDGCIKLFAEVCSDCVIPSPGCGVVSSRGFRGLCVFMYAEVHAYSLRVAVVACRCMRMDISYVYCVISTVG